MAGDDRDELDEPDREYAARIAATLRETRPVAAAGEVIYAFGIAAAALAAVGVIGGVVGLIVSRDRAVLLGSLAVALAFTFYGALLIGVGKSMTMASSYIELRTLEMERHWIAEDDEPEDEIQ